MFEFNAFKSRIKLKFEEHYEKRWSIDKITEKFKQYSKNLRVF